VSSDQALIKSKICILWQCPAPGRIVCRWCKFWLEIVFVALVDPLCAGSGRCAGYLPCCILSAGKRQDLLHTSLLPKTAQQPREHKRDPEQGLCILIMFSCGTSLVASIVPPRAPIFELSAIFPVKKRPRSTALYMRSYDARSLGSLWCYCYGNGCPVYSAMSSGVP
jgi:hypothetical protein